MKKARFSPELINQLNWYDKTDIINNLDWDKFQKTSIEKFEESYTIHDSSIIDITSSGNRDIFLVILWDPIWNDELSNYSTENVQRWPILFLFFTHITTFEIDFESKSDMPFGISTMESKELSDNKSYETILKSHYGDIMKIVHFGELKVLVYDENQNMVVLDKI